MPEANVTMAVRHVDPKISIIDIRGEVTAFAENALMAAYAEASEPAARAIILNFSDETLEMFVLGHVRTPFGKILI